MPRVDYSCLWRNPDFIVLSHLLAFFSDSAFFRAPGEQGGEGPCHKVLQCPCKSKILHILFPESISIPRGGRLLFLKTSCQINNMKRWQKVKEHTSSISLLRKCQNMRKTRRKQLLSPARIKMAEAMTLHPFLQELKATCSFYDLKFTNAIHQEEAFIILVIVWIKMGGRRTCVNEVS